MILLASKEGLETIIIPEMKKKGWTQFHSKWAREATVSVSVLKKFWQRKPIREESFKKICKAVGVDKWEAITTNKQHCHWGEAPDIPAFFGRETELKTLKEWIIKDRCRLIAIIGIGGIGKTAVSIKLGKGGIGKTDLSLHLAQNIQD